MSSVIPPGGAGSGIGDTITQGLGSIAGALADGYRQARAQKFSEQQAQADIRLKQAQTLLEAAGRLPDPAMRATATQHALDSMTDAMGTQQGMGIGDHIKSMFGFGKKQQQQAQPQATPMGPSAGISAPPANSPFQLPPVTAGSQTFGSAGPGAPMASAGVPSPVAAPAPQPNSPPLSPGESPLTPITQRASAQVPAPSVNGPSAAAFMPSANDLIAARRTESLNGANPFYETPESKAIALQRATADANFHAEHALSALDTFRNQEPQRFSTLQGAETDPIHGNDFSHILTTMEGYENSGLLPKGYVEAWEKQRFDDVRFGSEKYDAQRAFAAHSFRQIPGQPGKYEQIGGPSDEEQLTAARTAQAAGTATPEQLNLLAGDVARLHTAEDAKLLPAEQLQKGWIDEQLKKPGATYAKVAPQFTATFHPPQPLFSQGQPAPNPNNGNQMEVTAWNSRTGKPEFTGLVMPPNVTPERYMDKGVIQTPEVTTPEGLKLPGKAIDGWNAGRLIAGYPREITLPFMQGLLNSNADMLPDQRAKLKSFVDGENAAIKTRLPQQ